ncbi:hypothetical protein [Streptomyces tricolor]|uniref:hypothetical protein n=1 Tax=Streptomyces tricolor TaxID=68277 RepID=UPI0036F16DAD
MAKWWKFGLGKSKGREEGPRPEPTPAPRPTPAEGEKRGGLLGRLFGRKRKEEAPPEAPPAPPTPPPAEAPEIPPEAAPAEEAPPPAAPPPPERVYPPFLHVSAEGDWVISETEWNDGTMSGTLHGSDVKAFIDAMEEEGGPNYDVAIPLIADAYGIPGGLVNVGRSTIRSVDY